MHLDRRSLIHSQDAVVVKVRLLDPAILERHFTPQRGADAVHDAALDLRLDDLGVDDLAAVHRAYDPVHAYISRAGHFDFGYLRQVAAPAAVEKGNATPAAPWQWLAPSALLGREVQHGQGARRLAQHGTAERHRILRRRGGELVDEALDDEIIVGDAHAAPEAGIEHRLLVAHVLDLNRRDVVEQLDGPVYRVDILAVLEEVRQIARDDRRTDDPMSPG